MPGLNTSAEIAAFVNSIFEDALFVARDNNLMAALVTPFTDRQRTAARYNQGTVRPPSSRLRKWTTWRARPSTRRTWRR